MARKQATITLWYTTPAVCGPLSNSCSRATTGESDSELSTTLSAIASGGNPFGFRSGRRNPSSLSDVLPTLIYISVCSRIYQARPNGGVTTMFRAGIRAAPHSFAQRIFDGAGGNVVYSSALRSEERRVGKEGRSRWGQDGL